MAKGKLILICQSGGEFVTNDDGTMTYNGGEANAENVTSETPFNDVKLKLAEACDLDQKTITIKYFLPGNKKNLIVVKNDKDLKRMIDFHGDAITADVFVTGTTGFDRSALETESNRESGSKKDEKSNNDKVRNKKDESAKRGNTSSKKNETVKRGKARSKKDDKVPASPPYASPAKRTTRGTAAATADLSSDNTDKSDGTNSADSSNETSTTQNKKAGSDSGSASSDYVPRSSANKKKRNDRSENDVDASPADSVKKRRRTPSWKFGTNGRPTIVSCPEKDSKIICVEDSTSQRKSSRLAAKGDNSKEPKTKTRKRSRNKSTPPADDTDEELEENLPLVLSDDYALPETMVDSWKSAITGIGQEFDSVNEFRSALKKYAIANRFGYKFKKNDTSRAIGGCAAEGCTWRFYAVWVPTTQSFIIKTLNNIHTCDKESRKSAHPAKNWLVGTIKDRLRESPYLKPKEIANGLLQDFGVELNYTQVWRGIGDAREQLHGSLKESYNKLPFFCEKLVETNPGSVAKLVIGEKKRFKSVFISFNALLHGFQKNCRPLIFLEAASLKSRYGEVLLTANAIDGNDGFTPVAFAIVDGEDDDTWRWFLEELKSLMRDSRPITFVVDRDKNLKNIVKLFFENAYIGYSIYHLLASFKRNMKGPFHGDGKAFLTVHFLAAAHAVRLAGFKKSTEQIKLISSHAYDWVMQIEPEHWAFSSFKGERYNYITEDIGESFAKLMEDYRHLPILQKIDALIRTIIDDMEDARLDGCMWTTQLTGLRERELEEEKVKARGLKVLISSDTLFEVREDSTHVVNVSDWSCTCMGWKERGLPCRHALAVFLLTGKNPYDYCSSYFTADAYRLMYAESILPIRIDGLPLQSAKSVLENDGGEKMEKEGGEMYEVETGGTNVKESEKTEKEEGEKERLEIEWTEGKKVDKEESEKEKVETEGTNMEESEKTEKGEGEKETIETEGTNMEEGEKVEKEEGEKEEVEIEGINNEEGEKMEVGKDEGVKEGNEKDVGLNVDAENGEGMELDVEKDESGNVDVEKDKGMELDVEKDEGGNVNAEKDEGGNVDVEKDKGCNVVVEKDTGSSVDTEKDGSNLDAEKVEGTEKEEGSKLDVEKEEGGKMDAERDEGGKLDVEKEEGKMGKLREEHEDPNVFVLPPIPTKSISIVKKEVESGVETEGEMKRKVTCSKCKKPGHYKKSCKAKS